MEQIIAFFGNNDFNIKKGVLVGIKNGKPLWFNITQGEKSDEITTATKNQSCYELISLEGEMTNPVVILYMLCQHIDDLDCSVKEPLSLWIKLARRKGIKWSQTPLPIHFIMTYFYDKDGKFKIVLSVEEDVFLPENFSDITSECTFSEALDRMKELIEVLEDEAGIPVSNIRLSIVDELMQQMSEEDKQFFNKIDNEVII